MIEASVVIALYDGAATIGQQLDALLAQTDSAFEVVVADNGSTDQGPSIVASHPLRPRLVDAGHTQGQSYARNVGAYSARADRLLFCDQDDVVDRQWVAAMKAALDNFDIVGGRMSFDLLNDGPVSKWRSHANSAMDGKPLPAAWGCNLGVRRSVFIAVGGFRTEYRGGGEDQALSWDIQLAGYCFGYAHEAVVEYRYRRSLRAFIMQYYQYGREDQKLRRDFPTLELPDPTIAVPRLVGWLFKNSPLLGRRETQGTWLRVAAEQAGLRVGRRLYR